jgi:hypothetical protein
LLRDAFVLSAVFNMKAGSRDVSGAANRTCLTAACGAAGASSFLREMTLN